MKDTKATAARDAIAAIAAGARDPVELLDAVRERIDRVVPNDGGGWMLTDPRTMLPTVVLASDIGLSRRYFEHELTVPDINSIGDLQRRGVTVASLAETTGGRPELSARWRDVHVPHGLDAEARVVFRTGEATWALSCFSRAAGEPDFDAKELAWLRSIAPDVAHGLRAALARRPPEPAPEWAPGMLVLDEAGNVELTTGEADRWLAHMPGGRDDQLNPVILGVALQARAEALAAAPALESPAQARLRVDNGAWLYIHASALRDTDGAPQRIAVMLERADRAQLLPLLVDVHGLTARERDVVELLLSGLPTEDVASRMRISRHTVRDHVKAIFAKVGVASRAELTARFEPSWA
jgi:DNA-binding CsgD family transcriptional regulator